MTKLSMQRSVVYYGLAPLILTCIAMTSMGPTTLPTPEPVHPIGIITSQPSTLPTAFVGEPIQIIVQAENISERPVGVSVSGDLLKRSFGVVAYIKQFPGFHDFAGTIGGGDPGLSIRNGPKMEKDFVTLAPGEKTDPVTKSIIPLVPGSAEIVVVFESASNYLLNSDRQSSPYPNALHSAAILGLTCTISDKPSPALVAALADCKAKVQDPNRSMADRIACLNAMADQKHYFAAQFVYQTWKTATDPAIKSAALDKLIDLVSFGTAYEAFPDLLRLIQNETEPEAVRLKALDCFGKMDLFQPNGWPGIMVADQGFYKFSDEQATEARKAISAIAMGRDPVLAVRAQKIMKN